MVMITLSGCWTQFHGDAGRSGNQPLEFAITKNNVSNLKQAWTGATGGSIDSSPAIVDGVVYVGSKDHKLYAFDANGVTNCSGVPTACTPLWTGLTGGIVVSSPAVMNGMVYVGSADGKLYAFDATGNSGCSGVPKSCTPLWTGATTSAITSAPAAIDGTVYVGSTDHHLYAFDASGVTNCSGSPGTCEPLWTAATGDTIYSSPAVANGVVYTGSMDRSLYAFDASGVTNCSGIPRTCAPLWTAPTNSPIVSSPAVANGVVYIGSSGGDLFAFDANGVTGCSGTPKICSLLGRAALSAGNIVSAPAIANGVVYANATVKPLVALDAAALTGCSSGECLPLWETYVSGTSSAPSVASPAVANGVVFMAFDQSLHAYDAIGEMGCVGGPPLTSVKKCNALWMATTGGYIQSSPAVVNGTVYVGSGDGKLYAFR